MIDKCKRERAFHLSRSISRPRSRGSVPIGVVGVLIVIVLIAILNLVRPTALEGPSASAAATAVVTAGVGYLAKRALRSRVRLNWQLRRI